MEKRIALYKDKKSGFLHIYEEGIVENDPDYTRISEYVDVEFTLLFAEHELY